MRPALDVLRSQIGTWLTETGKVTRDGDGEPIFDESTGRYEYPPRITVYAGPMLVRPQDRGERVVEVGGATYALTRYDVTLPAEAAVVRGHQLEVTRCTFDPALVGVPMRLVDVPLDAWQVARYCVAERMTG